MKFVPDDKPAQRFPRTIPMIILPARNNLTNESSDSFALLSSHSIIKISQFRVEPQIMLGSVLTSLHECGTQKAFDGNSRQVGDHHRLAFEKQVCFRDPFLCSRQINKFVEAAFR